MGDTRWAAVRPGLAIRTAPARARRSFGEEARSSQGGQVIRATSRGSSVMSAAVGQSEAPPTSPPPPPVRPEHWASWDPRIISLAEHLFRGLCQAAAVLVIVLAVLLVGVLVGRAW